jgi:predicted acyltransferase
MKQLYSEIQKFGLMPFSQRFTALDVFRGMTICFMIIVNTPGDSETTFSPLLHAKWNGFTPTDLVFPSFLFAVGNAMSFVMEKWKQKKQSDVLLKILKRTALIFLLGYLMYWFPFFKLDENQHIIAFPMSDTRIMGVLQRIALCYGLTALMIYYFKPKITVMISIGLLLLYWLLMMVFGEPGNPLSLQGNAGLKFDLWLMGDKHLYHGEGIPFDPEGWLSTLPAIGNVVGGYIAGQWIRERVSGGTLPGNGKAYEGLAKLLLAGFALLIIAYCWNFSFPVNKKLWTSSFVLLTVGLDCIILAGIIYVIDFEHKNKSIYFFEVAGKNPLLIYLLSELLATVLYMIPAGGEEGNLYGWIYQNIFRYAGDYWGSLLFAVSYLLVCWYVGYLLDKRKIYVKV